MRVVLMSDVHGNLAALEAVTAAIPSADRVIVAGDLILEGPWPCETFDRLVALGWELLLGNTDVDILDPPAEAKPSKQAMVAWARERLGLERLDRLAALPRERRVEQNGEPLALVVHANPLNLEDQLYPTLSEQELEPYLAAVEARLLAFGHLHIPYLRPVNGILLADVSSVGHPKDLDRRAAYTVVEWTGSERHVTQVRVPYDIERAVAALRGSDMPHAEEEAEDLLRASY